MRPTRPPPWSCRLLRHRAQGDDLEPERLETGQDPMEMGTVDHLAQQDGLDRSLAHVELLEIPAHVRGQPSLDAQLIAGRCHGDVPSSSPACLVEAVVRATGLGPDNPDRSAPPSTSSAGGDSRTVPRSVAVRPPRVALVATIAPKSE